MKELTKTNTAVVERSQSYKQTEVGLIPEDWKVKELDAVLTFGSGQDYKHLNKGDIPVFGTGGVMTYVNNHLYEGESVGIGRKGTIDKPVFLTGKFWTVDTLFFTHSFNDVIPRFIYYKFLTIPWKEYNEASGVPSLNKNTLGKIQIPLPPTLTEQKAIATALSDVDELISNLEKLIAKKKAIKHGAMQELLTPPNKGGKRLAGFSGEWERIKVEKVIDVLRGGSPRPIQDYITSSPDGINWIKIGDTSPTSKYIVSSAEKIIPEGANYSRKVFSGDFLLSNSMSFGRPYILKIDGCIHDGWLVLQNYSESFDREFLYYTLMSKDVFNQYLSKASGSGVLNLNKELVKVVELNRPKDLEEQKAIAQILSDMDIELAALEAKKEKYKGIKQGMMQELLTGKIRLV
jgi:type I restriction enzyme, S subunit